METKMKKNEEREHILASYWHLSASLPLPISVSFDMVNRMHWLREIIIIKNTQFTNANFKGKCFIIGAWSYQPPWTGVPAFWAGINSPEHCCFILSYIKIRRECVFFVCKCIFTNECF